MKAHPVPVEDPPEPREAEGFTPEPHLLEDELTDEEAFYLAQEEAFAVLRARNAARPRRKL